MFERAAQAFVLDPADGLGQRGKFQGVGLDRNFGLGR